MIIQDDPLEEWASLIQPSVWNGADSKFQLKMGDSMQIVVGGQQGWRHAEAGCDGSLPIRSFSIKPEHFIVISIIYIQNQISLKKYPSGAKIVF
jgi:hypothetical protein